MSIAARTIAITILSIGFTIPAFGQTDARWNNFRGGEWSRAANWSPAQVPANGSPNPDDAYRAIFAGPVGSDPYDVTLTRVNAVLDEAIIGDDVLLVQHGGSLQFGTLNIGNGVYGMQGDAVLSNTNIRTSDEGGLVVYQGTVSHPTISGSLILEGTRDTDARLRNPTLQGGDILIAGYGNIAGVVEGNGRIVAALAPDVEFVDYVRVRMDEPVTIGPGVEVFAPTGEHIAFRDRDTFSMFGTMVAEGGFGFGSRFHNFGRVEVLAGGHFNVLSLRQADDLLPAEWYIESTSGINILSTFAPGVAHKFTAKVNSASNVRFISTRTLNANGVFSVEVGPTFMPRTKQPVQLWEAETKDGQFSELVLADLPAGFSWDSSEFETTGSLFIDGPTEKRVAYTEFKEPPIGAQSYEAGPNSTELGFESEFFDSGGAFPAAGVDLLDGERALFFQSVDSWTTFDRLEISQYANVGIDVEYSLRDGGYEGLDFIELIAFNDDVDESAIVYRESFSGAETETKHRRSIDLPSNWTEATFRLRTWTNSSSGEEQVRIHSVDVYAFGFDARGGRPGDFDVDETLDLDDLVKLDAVISRGIIDPAFDLDGNGMMNEDDRLEWIENLWGSYVGDSNLDGTFTSSDLVTVFRAGEYEDQLVGNSTWETGDWSGDREFNSSDMVLAFQRGGYEQGPRAAAVPEPNPCALFCIAALSVVIVGCRRRRCLPFFVLAIREGEAPAEPHTCHRLDRSHALPERKVVDRLQ